MKKTVIIIIASLLCACVSKYKTDSYSVPSTTLELSDSAYVMLAPDGRYGSQTYSGSGQTVSKYLYVSLSRYMSSVEIATALEQRQQALRHAKAKALTYVFEPVILNWEDRATEWSGKPDQISIHFSIWNVETEKLVASGSERASSKWFTFGGDHPQDLVPRMVDNFTGRLFR